jgi:hypothetical protein
MANLSLSQPKGASGFKLSNTKSFFEQFTKNKERAERGEFETNEEYQKRISKQFDTTTVFYFKLESTLSYLTKHYHYDIDSELLSVTGGTSKTYQYSNYQPQDANPVVILSRSESKGTYKASNAFGKTVTVEKTYFYDYVLSIVNSDDIPDSIFNKTDLSFTLSTNAPPKKAEQISKNLILVIGVKPLGYQQSDFECVLSKEPKIDDPSEIALFSYLIEAKFISLYLYNEVSKQILIRFQLPE